MGSGRTASLAERAPPRWDAHRASSVDGFCDWGRVAAWTAIAAGGRGRVAIPGRHAQRATRRARPGSWPHKHAHDAYLHTIRDVGGSCRVMHGAERPGQRRSRQHKHASAAPRRMCGNAPEPPFAGTHHSRPPPPSSGPGPATVQLTAPTRLDAPDAAEVRPIGRSARCDRRPARDASRGCGRRRAHLRRRIATAFTRGRLSIRRLAQRQPARSRLAGCRPSSCCRGGRRRSLAIGTR